MILGVLGGYQQLIVLDNGLEISYNHLEENRRIADLLYHDSFTIIGNSELSSFALSESWNGNGTSSNPFVIEGYSFFDDSISMSHTTFLSISDTSYYVTIRNCSFDYGRSFNYVIGISLENVTNTVIMNCSFNHLEDGIRIQNSVSCTVRNVTCTNLRYNGIYFLECQDVLAEHNTIVGGRFGISSNYPLDFSTIRNNTLINSSIFLSGDSPSHVIQNVSENTVNGLPFGYFTNVSNTTIDMTGYGSLFFANCSNIITRDGYFVNASLDVNFAFCRDSSIINVTSRYGSIGVYNAFCTNCTLINSKFTDNEFSVHIEYSENCKILENSFNANDQMGIELRKVRDIEVSGNNMSAYVGIYGDICNYGILASSCNDSIFNNNRVIGYNIGIQLVDSLNCNVTQNSINDNKWFGYDSIRSEHNYIFNNSILSNELYGIVLSYPRSDEVSYNLLIGNVKGMAIKNGSGCIFCNNSVSYNNHDGFDFWDSSYCTIINNTIIHNAEKISIDYQRGIYLSSNVSNFEIYDNIIGWNGEYNAWDDGFSNIWDDGTSIGNSWSDFATPPYYEIPGTAGSVDRYPSVIVDAYAPLITIEHSPTIPEANEIVTVSAVIFDHSELAEVILSYSMDDGAHWINITMEQNIEDWTAEIQMNSETELVLYKVYAIDILGNGAVSDTNSITVFILNPPITRTTVTSITSTTTSTSATTSTSNTTSSSITEPVTGGLFILEIGVFFGCGVVVILLVRFVVRGSTSK